MAQLQRIGRYLGWLLCLGVCCLGQPIAWATNWHLVADTYEGEQQFVDAESLQSLGAGRVQIRSYYHDARQGEPQITTYLTEYDCLHSQFRDVEYQGTVGSPQWQLLTTDPLNIAAMIYACERAGYPNVGTASGKN